MRGEQGQIAFAHGRNQLGQVAAQLGGKFTRGIGPQRRKRRLVAIAEFKRNHATETGWIEWIHSDVESSLSATALHSAIMPG